jgi:adenosylmethionine-8-amino-7-oxononanoate aminotransferase
VVLQRRTWPRRARGGGCGSDARARLVQHVRPIHEPACRAPGPARRDAFSGGGRDRVPHSGRGSDSIDTAVKLARAFWHVSGRPDKQATLSRSFAYYGVNAYGTSLGGIPADAAAFGRLVADVEQVAWDDAEALRGAIDRLGADRVAAFVCEPVVGAGGVLPPPIGYLERVAEICRANDVLLVVDEVITGFGRLGEWFGSERFRFRPDLVTVAKGLTSGYAPLGAVIASGRVAEPFGGRERPRSSATATRTRGTRGRVCGGAREPRPDRGGAIGRACP